MLSQSELLSKEYELFPLCVPHHAEFQSTIANLALTKALAINVKGNKPLRILEIGSGTGITTRAVLQSLNSINLDYTIDCVDNDSLMIEQLNNSVHDSHVKMFQSDINEYLENEVGRYDIVYSSFVIHNFEKEYRELFFEKLLSVISSGGYFINGDKYAYDNSDSQNEVLNWQLKQFDLLTSMGYEVIREQWYRHYMRDEQPEYIMKANDINSYISQIGFKNAVCTFHKGMESIYTYSI